MRPAKVFLPLALLLLIILPSSARAIDEGQTQPRLNHAEVWGNVSIDLIPSTSGSGNLKGIECYLPYQINYAASLPINIVVDGITRSITVQFKYYPGNSTGFIPMNVRFESSIRVQLNAIFQSSYDYARCAASWGLD